VPIVDSGDGGGRYGQVAVDDNDDPHVVWHDEAYLDVYYRTAPGGQWTEPIRAVTATQWDSRFPDVTVVGTTPHVAFEQDDESYSNCHPSYTFWTGNEFAEAEDLVTSYHSWPQIVADSHGHLHILYTRRLGDCEVKYRWGDGGAFASEQILSTSATNWTISSLAIDDTDTLHAVWHQLEGGNQVVQYAVGDAATGTWQAPRPVSDDPATANWLATVAVDPQGLAHVVWLRMEPDSIHEDSGTVHYRKVAYGDL